MRSFTKIVPSVWVSDGFRGLAEKEKLLMLYYLSGPHQTLIGVARVPDGYAAVDLDLAQDDIRSLRETLGEAKVIGHDAATDEVMIVEWWSSNPPVNPSHHKGAVRALENVKSIRLRTMCAEALEREMKRQEEAKLMRTTESELSTSQALRNHMAKLRQ